MFKTYQSESLAGIYKELYNDILNAPEICPRGLKTKELIAPQILLTNPRNRLAYHPERRFNLKYALVESLLLFDSTNKLKYFEYVNKNIKQFSDDGITLYGSYGYRIAEYIALIIDKFYSDPSSRQIVFPILKIDDVIQETKDIPCTLNLQFIIRDDKLNLVVNMRSNDIMWGLPYDIFNFTTFQEIIANTLGLELGWYLHRPISLHLYERHYKLFEKIADKFEPREVKIPYNYLEWKQIMHDYKYMVDGLTRGKDFEIVYDLLKRIYKGE